MKVIPPAETGSPCSPRVARPAPSAASGTGRPAASIPGTGPAPLLRRISIASPGCPDFHEVPGAVRLAADPAGSLGPTHRRLADPELPGQLPITGHAHPYDRPEVKS